MDHRKLTHDELYELIMELQKITQLPKLQRETALPQFTAKCLMTMAETIEVFDERESVMRDALKLIAETFEAQAIQEGHKRKNLS